MNIVQLKPTTTIKILRGVPLELSEDTLDFTDKTAQYNYFNSLVKYTMTDATPVDIGRKALIFNQPLANLMDCNFIMFQNSNWDNKWYYAYITNVSYGSPDSSRVDFEIDIMQTCLFDYSTPTAFIEREHVADDTIGAHTIPENVELGDYWIMSTTTPAMTSENEQSIVMMVTKFPTPPTVEKGITDGLYSGVEYKIVNNDEAGASLISTLIEQIEAESPGTILSLLKVPWLIANTSMENRTTTNNINRPATLNGYTPRNNKLFTYPYCCCVVTSNDGNYGVLRWEYSNDGVIHLKTQGYMSPNPAMILCPTGYKGVATGNLCYDEKMMLTGFPMCPYTTDTYKAWLAMNGSQTTVGVLGQALSAVSSGVTGGLIGGTAGATLGGALGVVQAGTGIAQTMARVDAVKRMPDQAHGTQSGNANFQSPFCTFQILSKTIRAEYAQMIDGYFDMYGYKVNRLGTPNTKSRANYNYIKTSDVRITGNIPQEWARYIANRYNAGVRFWHNPASYRDYSVNNEVIDNG